MSGDNLVVIPSGELPFACACAMRCDECGSSRPGERSGAEAEREDGFASGRMIDFQRLEDLDEAFARVVWMVMAHEAVD